ncbi:MAG TPA: hypothetical protein VH144_02410 [Candidatus Saccharimonadales bacterium]|jgi:hypothetical protein|nr:hypothetical protein [Candidatus Saccharimonadales bacterium]
MVRTYTYFAADSSYNCSAYGSGVYGSCAGQSGGPLANTGSDILLPLCLGAAIVIASAIWLVKRLYRRRQQPTA